jgi:thiaminase
MPRLETIYAQALRYEVGFWDMSYEGENWL